MSRGVPFRLYWDYRARANYERLAPERAKIVDAAISTLRLDPFDARTAPMPDSDNVRAVVVANCTIDYAVLPEGVMIFVFQFLDSQDVWDD